MSKTGRKLGRVESEISGVEWVVIRKECPFFPKEPMLLEQKFDYAVLEDQFDQMEDEVNGEALEALEENLMRQLNVMLGREKEFMEMTDRVSAMNKDVLSSLMEKTKEFKEQDGAVSRDVKDYVTERDQAMTDLRNVEQAFSDVHRKYERAKATIENLKHNEEHLLERDEQLQLAVSARDQKYEAFKQEAQQSIEKIYNDFQGKIAALEADCGRLTAQLRRVEMRTETLQAELDHKKKENGELNKLADELIGRATGSNTMLM